MALRNASGTIKGPWARRRHHERRRSHCRGHLHRPSPRDAETPQDGRDPLRASGLRPRPRPAASGPRQPLGGMPRPARLTQVNAVTWGTCIVSSVAADKVAPSRAILLPLPLDGRMGIEVEGSAAIIPRVHPRAHGGGLRRLMGAAGALAGFAGFSCASGTGRIIHSRYFPNIAAQKGVCAYAC
jgi:hypothetical protein